MSFKFDKLIIHPIKQVDHQLIAENSNSGSRVFIWNRYQMSRSDGSVLNKCVWLSYWHPGLRKYLQLDEQSEIIRMWGLCIESREPSNADRFMDTLCEMPIN